MEHHQTVGMVFLGPISVLGNAWKLHPCLTIEQDALVVGKGPLLIAGYDTMKKKDRCCSVIGARRRTYNIAFFETGSARVASTNLGCLPFQSHPNGGRLLSGQYQVLG